MREVKEETDVDVENLRYKSVTNDISIGGNPLKHYITIFMIGDICPDSPPVTNMEPDKCFGWEWTPIETLLNIEKNCSAEIFDPLRRFISENIADVELFK